MKPAGMFVSSILVIDTFLVSFYLGFNSRHVLVVDPSLKPVASAAEENPSSSSPQAKKPDAAKDSTKNSKNSTVSGKTHGAKKGSSGTKPGKHGAQGNKPVKKTSGPTKVQARS